MRPIVMLEYSSITYFPCPGWGKEVLTPKIWQYMAPSIVPLMRWSCPVPLAVKHPQIIMFPSLCLTLGMVFLGRQHSSSSKHGELSWYQRVQFWSHLTTTLSNVYKFKLSKLEVAVMCHSWYGGGGGGPKRSTQTQETVRYSPERFNAWVTAEWSRRWQTEGTGRVGCAGVRQGWLVILEAQVKQS